MSLNRRAFTLAEMLVALTLGSLVATVVLKLLNTTQRASQTITERINVQQNLRDGVYFISTALREIDAGDGDIIQMDSTSVKFRGMTWTSILCAAPLASGANVLLPIRNDAFYGSQLPSSVQDSVLIYREGDPLKSTDDRWLPGAVVSTASSVCTDGTGANLLTIRVPMSAGGRDSVIVGVTNGAPIRGFQAREISVMSQNGRNWLGISSATNGGSWSTTQPLLGPLLPDGMKLTYLDTAGAVTATATDVAAIHLSLRGESLGRARTSRGTIDYIADSLETRIAVRNNPR